MRLRGGAMRAMALCAFAGNGHGTDTESQARKRIVSQLDFEYSVMLCHIETVDLRGSTVEAILEQQSWAGPPLTGES